MTIKIDRAAIKNLKQNVRQQFWMHGDIAAVAIARQNAPEDTGALKRSIRFESVNGQKPFDRNSDEFQLIAGGVIDPDRPDGVDYAEIQELIHAYLRSAIPVILKFRI